jgi:hypothetical protein
MYMGLSNFALLTTFALAVGALWIALSRSRTRLDSNWPLLFYGAVLLHANSYPFVINAWLLYVTVVCGLLLRFEFMNTKVVSVVRVLEIGALMALSWQMFRVLWVEYA